MVLMSLHQCDKDRMSDNGAKIQFPALHWYAMGASTYLLECPCPVLTLVETWAVEGSCAHREAIPEAAVYSWRCA
jgi:hypothetical protein